VREALVSKVQAHRDLEVYQRAFGRAMEIFEVSKGFPKEERRIR
jgi:hypothetical protein